MKEKNEEGESSKWQTRNPKAGVDTWLYRLVRRVKGVLSVSECPQIS